MTHLVTFTAGETLLLRSCLLSAACKHYTDEVVKDAPVIVNASRHMGEPNGTPEGAALIMGATVQTETIWNSAVDMLEQAKARSRANG